MVSFTRSTTIRVFTLCVVIALSASILYSVRRGFAAAVPKAELSVTPLTASQLQLSWRLTDTGSVGSVLIYRALSANGEYSLIRTAAANIASYTDIGLNSNTVYYYQVKIRAPLGNITASSNIASAVTLAGVSSPTPTPTPAATPTPTPVASPTPTPEPAPSPGRLPGIYAAPNGSPNNNGSLERPIDLATALSTRSPARPGATIWLRGGTYRGAFTSFLAGTSSAPITVRQYPGERATIDGATSSNPALTVNGQWTNYWGFEVTNSNPDRTLERPSGLMIYGPYTKFINLVVHDTGVGMGFWTPALNAEIYGCIVYRNGWQGPAPDRGHGHGIYSQNAEGTKRIVDNIIFNQFGYGIHNYTQAGDLKGFYIEGNIVFRNGSMATPNDVDDPNILVGGTKPAERVTLKNNYTYHPLSMVATNVGLNYNAKNNRDLVVEGNYIAGGSPLSATEWYQLSGSNNTLIGARDILGFVLPAGLPTSDYLWDRNTYISTHPSAGASPMTLYSTARTGAFTFAEWPSVTGFDRNSTFLRVSRPTGIKAFVRANQYEAGRANIVIYNWDLNPTVDLNLGGLLANGARYEIRNVHDFYGSPVVSGIYDGRPVRLPMNGSPTGPEFNAFVLITLSGVSTSINPTPTPSATPAPTPAPTPTPTPAPTPTPPSLPSDFNPDITLDEEETLLLDLINQYRLQNGRNPLGASISLCNASEWLSRDMLTFNHTNKIDSLGRSPARRARDFGFPGNSAPIEEDALLAAGDLDAQRVFDLWRGSAPSSQMLLAPNWKAAGLARSLNPLTQRWYWNVATGAYWDKTILLAGEDEEGKIDRNELIRTRPLDSSLQEEHRFSGYGDDGSTYTPIHCDLTLNSQFCWHDPPPQTNRKLLEPSLPANLAGAWQVAYTISSLGIVHANYDQWDRTNFSMEFQINPGGTWTMRGYRSSQYPVPSESGTWQSTRDVDRNEETVTFIRQNALPRATIRIHATRDQLTFFAIDGGAFMKNFLRGLLPDDMPKDDPQIVFVPKR